MQTALTWLRRIFCYMDLSHPGLAIVICMGVVRQEGVFRHELVSGKGVEDSVD